ncbi:MAG: hypothetical protein ACR2KK_06835 [Acidimicrobiales bacterium]
MKSLIKALFGAPKRLAGAALLLLILAMSTASVGAQAPPPAGGQAVESPAVAEKGASPDDVVEPSTDTAGSGLAGTSVAGASSSRGIQAGDTAGPPAAVTWWDIRGGYVAAGTGLRNRGFGTISLTGIPAGATITKAYLTWAVLGGAELANFKTGTFKGVNITGAKAGQGANPCWPGVTTGYSYRADVTAQVTGNGAYALSNFASGQTNGADPWTSGSAPPLAEGASLFVVYTKATYPQTVIRFYNGYHMTDNTANAATLSVPFGFTASNPAGEARTTFIGADGQTASEPFSTVNGVSISAADWDGTDPPIPRYSQGNLWDTDTVQLRDIVKPGHTSAAITVTGGGDCIVWVAQAFSLGKFGQVDTDGDKLLDGWEANGHDANNNGTIDVNLPALGASVVRKDLFVEMDYMGAEAACPCHLPLAADLDRIRAVYAAAPVSNPNGVFGINIHLDAGAARGAAYNLGGGNLVAHDTDLNPVLTQFNAIKAANFNALRAKTFYYMIWAHGYDGGSSSGNAFAIPNDSFVVTLGLWGGHGSSDAKVGTFIHEFGHDLGLGHGGNEGKNYKPNYLSVMSYFHQVSGVLRVSGAPYFGYSNADLPDLVESALNENVGLNSPAAAPFRAKYFCPNDSQALTPGTSNGPIDWTCSGFIANPVSSDINGDNVINTLTGWNDWANLVYGGGAVGAGAEAGLEAEVPQQPAPNDLTWEEFLQQKP